jgi:hypothetical protein
MKSFMATWDESDEKSQSVKDYEEANLGLMATTTSDAKPESDSKDELLQRYLNWYHYVTPSLVSEKFMSSKTMVIILIMLIQLIL